MNRDQWVEYCREKLIAHYGVMPVWGYNFSHSISTWLSSSWSQYTRVEDLKCLCDTIIDYIVVIVEVVIVEE